MDVVPKAVIAALVGTVCGVTAGVWSLRQPAAKASVSAPSVAAPATAIATDRKLNSTSSTPAAANTDDALPSPSEDAQVVERARTLARRPDVAALMALRDDVVRRATERGIAGSPGIKSELDAIDSSLNDARLLRLKLDAEELRRAESK